jgi:adenylate cyclase
LSSTHGQEIERKFRVVGDGWRDTSTSATSIEQGYLHVGDDGEIRVRVRDDEATLTVKRGGADLVRAEVEVTLALDAARRLLAEATIGRTVTKTRHLVPIGGFEAEVDEYTGELTGLVIAEVELPDADTKAPHADWLGDEVTGDGRYYNATLATTPRPAPEH